MALAWPTVDWREGEVTLDFGPGTCLKQYTGGQEYCSWKADIGDYGFQSWNLLKAVYG